jgi:hypothetical protein
MRRSNHGQLWRRLRARRVAVWLGVALAVILAVIVGQEILASSDAPSRGAEEGATNGLAKLPVGWTKLRPPPEVRDGAAFVWTGSELVAWGGCAPRASDACDPTADGFAFDPANRSWERISAAPLAATSADAIWTGEEAIFLHPVSGRLGGQAYDPRSGEWREISIAPIAPRNGGIRVWTDAELVVWGGGRPGEPAARSGAAYDPSSDTWRPIAQAPIGLNLASGMWTGRELLVFGSLLNDRNVAETRTAVGAAYHPATDSWREISPSRLSPQATSAVWRQGRIVAWDYEVRSQEYNPGRDTWTAPIRMPLDFSECYPDSVVVRDLVFAFFCGRAALYDAATASWREIHGGPLEAEVKAGSGTSYKLWRSASLVPTERVVFLVMEGVTTGRRDGVCYRCSGSPVAYWVYRPPDQRTD